MHVLDGLVAGGDALCIDVALEEPLTWLDDARLGLEDGSGRPVGGGLEARDARGERVYVGHGLLA